MVGPDPWISRGSLVATTVIALSCLAAMVVEDFQGRTPSQFILIIGTAAVTQLGNIIAALYPSNGRSAQHDTTPSGNGDSPPDGLVVAKKGAVP